MRPSFERNLPGEKLRDRAADVADVIDARYHVRERAGRYEKLRLDRASVGASELHLEDVTGIPFVSEIPGVEEYQHRARVRAETGDLFATVTKPADEYEAYNREVLGLGEPELVVAEPDGAPMAVAEACRRGAAYRRIREFAEQQGRLVIHPYMAIEAVWQLAAELEAEGPEVRVLGPPPPVLWIANDKARIAEINAELFEASWNVATRVEEEPEGMARGLIAFAEQYERVGVKRTRCASAMGNLVLDSEQVLEAGLDGVLRRVQRFLGRTDWPGGEEVLVVEWVTATHSPSTQTWIPPAGQGVPYVDGIYEQLLESEEQIFVGSRPSRLPDHVQRRLGRASVAVGCVLQELGYVGRCSFDFLVAGEPDEDWSTRMIECNGRWGGTSTPMHFVDRLVGGERPPYVAMDFVHPDLVGVGFPDVLEATGQELYDPATGKGRFAFYNPGPLAETGKFDVVSIGETVGEAKRGVEEVLPELLGLR